MAAEYPEKSAPDEHLDDWLEGESNTDALPEDENAYSHRIADLSVAHAMLVHVTQKDQLRRERRIQSVMTALDGNAEQTGSPRNPMMLRRLFTASASAAAIILLMGVFLWGPADGPGVILARAEAAAQQRITLKYAISMFLGMDRESAKDASPTRSGALYVGGKGRFLIHVDLPFGQILTLGSDGQSAFVVPPRGPVLINDNPQLPELIKENKQVELPFTDLSSLIVMMKQRFDLKIDMVETIDGESITILSGALKPEQAAQRSDVGRRVPPDTATLMVNSQTGKLHHVSLHWDETELREQRVVQLDLIGEVDKADNWYLHQSHHGIRPVIRGNGS